LTVNPDKRILLSNFVENNSHIIYNWKTRMTLRLRDLPRLLPTATIIGLLTLLPISAGQAQTGLLIVAHGAGPEWNARVRQTTAMVAWPRGPVATAFLMGAEKETAGWDSAAAELVRGGAREIVVVPFMVSSFGAHYRQIRFYAGELDEMPAELAAHDHGTPPARAVPMRVTSALDGAPELGLVLRDRWRALPDTDRRRALMLVAHGPSTDEEARLWVSQLEAAAAGIEREGRIPVEIGLLRDDAPAPMRAAAIAKIHEQVRALVTTPGDSVTVMPVLISSGRIDRVTIPKDLTGLPVRYSPMVLAPHELLARWIERLAIARIETTP
jgi:sirohydrochlorin cobaltochelatase